MGKQEIIDSRTGGFGSSDAKIISSIGRGKRIGKTALKRIEVMLGMRTQRNFSNAATRYGDYIENELFKAVKACYGNCKVVSNPYCEIRKLPYSFKCFNHIDIEMTLPKRLIWIEVKAVNESIEEAMKAYKQQLCWHSWILEQESRRRKLTGELYLGHYHTKDKKSLFNPERLTVYPVDFDRDALCDITTGLEITESEILNIKEGKYTV